VLLRNLLTSFVWNSLMGRSGRRLRRRHPVVTPISPAAQLLERRQMLSNANVNLSVVAGAITLTATDSGDHGVDVNRADPTNVAFHPGFGTQITYLGVVHTSPFNVAIPAVASVGVNLGTGFDTYDIDNLSTSGNITFQRNAAGLGANVEITSEGADMVVGGSVIFNVGNQNGRSSFQEILVDNSGNLTINGTVQVNESGPGFDETEITTEQTGNLLVGGSVLITKSGAGETNNTISTAGSGNETINGSVSINDSGSGSHIALGGDFQESSTKLTVGGPVLIVTGAGTDDLEIGEALFRSTVTINTGTNPTATAQSDFIDIAASEFDRRLNINMPGANAEIDVGLQLGLPPTVFNRRVSVSMNGPGATIFLSNKSDSGTPVAFNSRFKVVGGSGGAPAGTLFVDGPVHFASPPKLVNFARVG